MYVINGKEWEKDKIYECGAIIATWLIYTKHMPLFSRDTKTNRYYFAKTEALENALKEMPFYLNIAKAF